MNKFIYALVAAALMPWNVMAQTEATESEKDSKLNTQAISTVDSEVLEKFSSPNVANTLYGLLPGLTMKQNTGWLDEATPIVRAGGSINGSEPLVVVDGVVRPMSYIKLREIETISVLKDAAATAIYGTRGANGVILITTKRGTESKSSIDVNYTYGIGLPINTPEMASAYDYATAVNQALVNDGITTPRYDDFALEAYKSGTEDSDLYPNVNWQDEVLRQFSQNNQLSMVFTGGSKRVKYYSAIDYKNEYGLLNNNYTDYTEIYNSQMKKYNLSARINLDAQITKTTKVAVNMYGMLDENKRPNTSEWSIFNNILAIPSAAFPVKTQNGYWGGDETYSRNPVAAIADVGYFKTHERLMMSDVILTQELDVLTEGLKFEANVSYDNSATLTDLGSKKYLYEVNSFGLTEAGTYDKISTLRGEDEAISISNRALAAQFMRTTMGARFMYDRTFDDVHHVTGALRYDQESYLPYDDVDGDSSFDPTGRNKARYSQSIMLTAGYNYANKYLVDVVSNYSGTSLLPEGGQFVLYPAVSAGWVISNEDFLVDNENVNFLKLRASYGLSGYEDALTYDLERSSYVSAGKYSFLNNNAASWGTRLGAPGMELVLPEMSESMNIGLDANFFNNRLSLAGDLYSEHRTNALVGGSAMVSGIYGIGASKLLIGESYTQGAELSAMWRDNVSEDFSYYLGGNVAYNKSEIIENGEGYKPFDYQYTGRYTDANGVEHAGRMYGQMTGLEAIGFFSDLTDIENSPEQLFGEVKPGDIKYKDQNNDGVIDTYDVVAIGNSNSIPAVNYGFQLGFEYKGFGVDAYFQGITGYSRMLSTSNVYRPLASNGNISNWYLYDQVAWTPETATTATMPRLSTGSSDNNFRNSTQWLVDGSYLKLRNLNVHYTLPQSVSSKIGMSKCQVFVRGNNLFSLDNVKYLNCEDFSVDYVDLSEWYLGVNLVF